MQEEKSNERQKTIISFLSSAWKLSFLVKRECCAPVGWNAENYIFCKWWIIAVFEVHFFCICSVQCQ